MTIFAAHHMQHFYSIQNVTKKGQKQRFWGSFFQVLIIWPGNSYQPNLFLRIPQIPKKYAKNILMSKEKESEEQIQNLGSL